MTIHTQDFHQPQAYIDHHRRQAFNGQQQQHGQYGQFPANTGRTHEMPLYYYPYAQQQNHNGHYGEAASYNQRMILRNVYQEPQQRAAPSHANYTQIDGWAAHILPGNMNANHPKNIPTINANNFMSTTYNIQMNLNANVATDTVRPIIRIQMASIYRICCRAIL